MTVLFSTTLLVAAGLLFTAQPMFARMALPLLGGTPAVWNTAMVFFQVALLLGYAWAHGVGTRTATLVPWLHVIVLAAGALLLPIGVPGDSVPPAALNPTAWLIALMATSVGGPFLLVSTTAPLLQRWFARTGHRRAADPYFLYVASNTGSLLGLLAYPFVIEPRLSLAEQTRLWSLGYGLLAVLVAACAFAVWRGAAGTGTLQPARSGSDDAPVAAPSAWIRVRWVFLAFVPSSLMLGVTSHLSTDIAAIPLLWVVPLALYLVSFIVAFSSASARWTAWAGRALPFAVVGLLIVIQSRANQPLAMIVGMHLVSLLLGAIVAHGSLAASRPEPRRLTEFYLWISLGGALGGTFNAIVAPLMFDTIVEYKVALVLACLCLPWTQGHGRARILDVVLPAVIGLLFIAGAQWVGTRDPATAPLLAVLLLAITGCAIFVFRRRPLRMALSLAIVFLVRPWGLLEPGHEVFVERSFFGVHRVLDHSEGDARFHVLMHGTTVHGMQRIGPPQCTEPLGYYHRGGPAAQVMVLGPGPGRRVGVAGLGSGGLAAYARDGDRWTFFEIDPAVQRIAADTSLFCYLRGMSGDAEFRLGDARLTLSAAQDRFDLLVLDAYSSDAMPIHLLTREALELYLSRLAPGGVIAVHISNRNFDLKPVVATLAADLGLACLIRDDSREVDPGSVVGAAPSEWGVLAREQRDLSPLAADPRWKRPRGMRRVLWTDDHSSLVSVLR